MAALAWLMNLGFAAASSPLSIASFTVVHPGMTGTLSVT